MQILLQNRAGYIGAMIMLVASAAQAAEYYLAAGGAMAGQGTKDQPFATLEQARDVIRELNKTGPSPE